MFNGVKVILILVVSGVILRRALDFFVQLFFQFLIVLLCAPDVPVLGGVDGLPGNMRSAGKQNRAGRKRRHDQQQEQKKNAHDHKRVCVALCKVCNAIDCGTDCRPAFVRHLLYAGPGCRCTARCSFAAAGRLRSRTA